MHCGKYRPRPISRRTMLQQAALGFGGVALAGLTTPPSARGGESPFAPKPSHFPRRAKSVIFLYMDGGPSQVDLFDPKPRLTAENGQPIKMKVQPTQFDNIGNVLGALWPFANYGQSGIPLSTLLPNIGRMADDLCVVRSMTSEFPEHTNANYFLHTGHGQQGRPSMGAWASYGLGNESENLPGFMVLNGGLTPPGGFDNFHSGFLPASHQGSVMSLPQGIADLKSPFEQSLQAKKLKMIRRLDENSLNQLGKHDALESAIANYELAFRMQTAMPDLLDVSQESKTLQEMYGLFSDYAPTRIYGQQCLVARRMVERGVRFIEITCPSVGSDRWDQHANLKKGHEDNCRAVDQPIGALLADLKSCGLLEETLVVWAGEFGRTPMAQGENGRDHNPYGFSIWMAGGGIKGGMTYGATDDYGYYAVEGKLEIHDLHATMLHLLGIDHTRLTVRHGGRDMRLTDVFGHVVHEILT